jgi:SAM-dependent methyltransferase
LQDQVADSIVRQLQPRRVLDAGCTKGFLVAALRERGVEAVGFDVSEVAIAGAPEAVRPYVRVGSLTEPIEGRYDLVTCIGVIGHLDPADTLTAVSNVCGASDRVLLSSTPGDYDGAAHVNVQPPERWSQAFAGHGFFRDFRHDASYLSPWAVLYRREERSITDVVVEYDRAWAQLRAETLDQRRALRDLQHRLEELQPSQQEVEAGQAEIERLRKEVLRLRDAVVGKDAELGTALGRVAEMKAVAARAQHHEQRLQAVLGSRSWRLMWAAGRPLRALRSSGTDT